MLDTIFKAVFYVVLLLGVLGGFALLGAGLANLRVAALAMRWPRARLELVDVRTTPKKVTHLVRQGTYTNSGEIVSYDTRSHTVHHPVLTYAFEVNGTRHEAMNVDPWNAAGASGKSAGAVVRRCRAWGERRDLAYDPKDPARHLLGRDHFPLFETLLGLTLGPVLLCGLVPLMRDLLGLFGMAAPTFGEDDLSVFWWSAPLYAAVYVAFIGAKPLRKAPSPEPG